jgi:hypothetical protein
MLRNFSADAPAEGRSSFAVEMLEMRAVLEDATPASLVLVDELGKGTEVRAGAALAGAMLEALDGAAARGVFATHLHLMLGLGLDLKRTERMAMEVEWSGGEGGAPRRGRPTWRVVPGECTDSLALDVAERCGLPRAVLDRAAALYAEVQEPAAAGAVSGAELAAAAPAAAALEGGDDFASAVAAAFDGLAEAAAVLGAAAREALAALDGDAGPRAVRFVPAGANPPPSTVGAACVYVARRPDGWHYVGSSDALGERIAVHRRRGGGSPVADPGAAFAYVALAAGEGAAARTVEAAAIKAMAAAGVPLLSSRDAARRHAPTAR